MKNKWIQAALVAVASVVIAFGVQAADAKEEKTIEGTGLCAKCSLKETESCQNAIQVEQDGKKITYYLAQNDVSKSFHKNVCKSSEKVRATGTVKEVDGKKELTVSKIELVQAK